MADIKTIGPSQYESYSSQILFFNDVLNVVDDLTSIKIEGKEYVVARDGHILSIVYDNGGELEGFGLILDSDGKLIVLIDEKYMHEISGEQEAPFITRTTIETGQKQFLGIEQGESGNKYGKLIYCSRSLDSAHELKLVYNMEFFPGEIGTFLDYNSVRLPNAFMINHLKPFLNRLRIIKKEWFLQLQGDDEFARMLIHFDFPFIPVSIVRTYTFQDLKDYVSQYGLSATIPKQMCDIAAGRDKKVKTLEKVSNIYRNYLG